MLPTAKSTAAPCARKVPSGVPQALPFGNVLVARSDPFEVLSVTLTARSGWHSMWTSLGLDGRPRLATELSYFLAASCRNQARMVSGLTSWQHLRRSYGVNSLPAVASRRR